MCTFYECNSKDLKLELTPFYTESETPWPKGIALLGKKTLQESWSILSSETVFAYFCSLSVEKRMKERNKQKTYSFIPEKSIDKQEKNVATVVV